MLTEKTNETQGEKIAPIAKFRYGNVTASIWKQEFKKTDSDETDTFHNVTIQKSYKDKNDEWQNTTQLGEKDLHKAIIVLQECNKLLNLKTN